MAVPVAGTQAARYVQRRDSAGIEIVVSERPVLQGEESWSLTPDPVLRIGAVAGTDGETLFRVTHAARLSDGRIVVLNGGTREVRYYSSSGSLEKSVGRSGAGPGDFRTFSGLQVVPRDSVLVFDGLNNRVSVFDADGELGRIVTFRLPEAGGSAHVVGRTGDGTFLATSGRAVKPDRSSAGKIVHETVTVIRYDAVGQIESTLGDFDNTEMAVYLFAGGLRATPPPFWRQRLLALRGDDLVTGHTRSFEFREIGPGGEIFRIIRAPVPALPVSAEDREPYAAQASRIPQFKELFRLFGFPETHPAFKRMLVDKAGNLWVEPHVRLGSDPGWAVFDRLGRWVTDVRVPASFQPMEIGEDYVLGVWRDELGVEYIDLRHLQKGDSGNQ